MNKDELLKYEYYHNLEKYQNNMLGITWLTTWACNLNCTYCFEGENKKSYMSGEEDIEILYNFIKGKLETGKFKSLLFSLFGGELMVNFKGIENLLPRVNELCKEHDVNIKVVMISNGLLLDEEKLKFFEKNNLQRLQLTLDGTEEIHNVKRITHDKKGTFKETIEKLKLIKKVLPKINLTVRINIDKETSDTVESLLKFLSDEGLKDCQIDFGIIRGESQSCKGGSSICYSEEEMGDLFYTLWNNAKENGFKIPTTPITKYTFCGLNSEQNYTFTPENELYKCWEYLGDDTHKFGYLDENGLHITNEKYYQWMNKNPTKIDECKECGYLPVCAGGCTVNAYNRYGKYDAPGCFKIKGVIENGLLFAIENK